MKTINDWITIETDISMPKSRGKINRSFYRNFDSDTESESYSQEELTKNFSIPEYFDDENVSSEENSESSESSEDPNYIFSTKTPNHHWEGYNDSTRGIKITAKKPNIRFLQLVTRYNIDEHGNYNKDISVTNADEEEARLTAKEYSTASQIQALKLYEQNLDSLAELNWAVDCRPVFKDEQKRQLYYKKGYKESPYYDQPSQKNNSGNFTISEDRKEKSLYDEPDLPDMRNKKGLLCEDTVMFITFIIDENTMQALAHIVWSRVGRPYIASRSQDKKEDETEILPWKRLIELAQDNREDSPFLNFSLARKHTYSCEYKIQTIDIYSSPRPLPNWVMQKLASDAKGRKYSLTVLSNIFSTNYPGLLEKFGVSASKATGPRAAQAIEKISSSFNSTALAVKTGVQFSIWAEKHSRNFNMKEVKNFIDNNQNKDGQEDDFLDEKRKIKP